MGIRQRLAEMIGGNELRAEQEKIKASIRELYDAYLDGPFERSPEDLVEQLREYDSAALVDLIHDIEYERIGGVQYSMDNTGRRDRQVKESQRMWMNSPLAVWTVNVWTSYGLGENISIVTDDETAQEPFDECLERSFVFDSDKIHELSNWVLVNGNDYLVQFVSQLDGTSTWGMIDSDEIVDIVRDDNSGKPLFYKRQFSVNNSQGKTWYYPNAEIYLTEDWPDNAESKLPNGSTVTDNITGNQTIALMLHIAHNRKDPKQLYGWPILGVTAPYMRAHKEFVENRLTVSRHKASYVREYTTRGGSRGVAALKAKLNSTLTATNYSETNPAATAGSELIHNEAVSMKDLGMSTGAGDAKQDNEMFAWLALIGGGLFPTSAGLDTSRWATAVAMDKTQATQWTRYQTFWSNQFKRIVKCTLLALEQYGGKSFESYGATVSIDTLSLVDFPGVVQPISQMLNAMLPYVENGVIPTEAAKKVNQSVWYIILQSLGVHTAQEITSDESFELAMPQEAAEIWNELRKLNRLIENET